MEARSFSFQAVDVDRDGRWNDERAQHWRRIFRFWEGSICRHNFTGIAYQECRWTIDYCFSIRSASPRSSSLLNGRRWRRSSTVTSINCSDVIYPSFQIVLSLYCMPILHLTPSRGREQVWIIEQPFTSDYSEIIFRYLSLETKGKERIMKIAELTLLQKRKLRKSFFY